MAMELNTPADGVATEETPANTEGGADPKASAAQTDAAPAQSAAPAETGKTNEPDYKSLSAQAESERDALRAELEALKGEHQPYAQLKAVAAKDPAQWLAEMAAATGVTPERVLELVAKRGSGDKPALTADERLARLEARLEEERAERAAEREEAERRTTETRQAETRRANVSVVGDFIQANSKEFPGLDDQDADAVYTEVEKRYAALPEGRRPQEQAALRALYLDAAKHVEAGIRKDADRRYARFGYSKPTTVKAPEGFKGLSLATTTAPAPVEESDRAHSSEDIDAIAQRFLQ